MVLCRRLQIYLYALDNGPRRRERGTSTTVLWQVAFLPIRWDARARLCRLFVYQSAGAHLGYGGDEEDYPSRSSNEEVLRTLVIHQLQRLDMVVGIPHERWVLNLSSTGYLV